MFDRFAHLMHRFLVGTEPRLFVPRVFEHEEDARMEAMRLTFTHGKMIVGKQRPDGRWELREAC